MRWKLGDDAWECERIVGKCQAISADRSSGRLTLRGHLKIDDGTAFVYRDPDTPMHQEVAGQRLPNSFWRICYARGLNMFRLRNEVTQEATLFVLGYVGDLQLSWRDRGSHVFHSGYWIIDSQNMAHAYI
jgi:hypothetical protein